jgi:hypothetical protein
MKHHAITLYNVLQTLHFFSLLPLSGSAYLANIHFRRVKKLQPNYPSINNLLEYLDQYEMRHALRFQTETLEVRKVILNNLIYFFCIICLILIFYEPIYSRPNLFICLVHALI